MSMEVNSVQPKLGSSYRFYVINPDTSLQLTDADSDN